VIDRRSILKLLPAAVPLAASATVGKEFEGVVEPTAHAVGNDRVLIVFRLTRSMTGVQFDHFMDNARQSLERAGLKDIPAFVLPFGVEMDVFSLPPGGVPCSESERSNSASSAQSR